MIIISYDSLLKILPLKVLIRIVLFHLQPTGNLVYSLGMLLQH